MTTDIDTQDRVPVPHFKQRLWTELARVHAEQAELADTRSGAPRTRRWHLIGAAAAATVAVGVATVAVLSSPDAEVETSGDYALLPVSARFDEGGDLVDQMIAAMGQASDEFIVHTVTHTDADTIEVWVDWPTTRYRTTFSDADGVPFQEAGGTASDATNDVFGGDLDEDDVMRIVSHCRHEVSDETQSAMTATPAWPFRDEPDGFVPPSEITAVVDGHETVDGRDLVRVKVAETGEVVLVDPATSLPVSGITEPGTPDQALTTYDYLPRSPENLELMLPPSAPDSYEHIGDAQIEAPPWDAERPLPEPDCSSQAT